MKTLQNQLSVITEAEGRKSFLHISGVSVYQLEAFLSDESLKRTLEGNRKSTWMQDLYLYREFKERYPKSKTNFVEAVGYYFSRRTGWLSFEPGIGGMLESQAREVQYFLDTCQEEGLDMELVEKHVTELVGKLYNQADEEHILSKEHIFGLESFGIKETAMDKGRDMFYLPFSMPFVEYLSHHIAFLLKERAYQAMKSGEEQQKVLTGEELMRAVVSRTRRYSVAHVVDTSHYSQEQRERILANLLCYLFKKRNNMDISDCQIQFGSYSKRIESHEYLSVKEID